jgi:exopolysaccharide production repressor protein
VRGDEDAEKQYFSFSPDNERELSAMRFPNFFIGMFAVLIAFAITTYVITQSLWATIGQTLICAVVIQIGYFAAVLFLVMREKPRRSEKKQSAHDEGAGVANSQRPFKSISPTKTH